MNSKPEKGGVPFGAKAIHTKGLSYEDGLTGLGNRRRLDQLLDEHLATSHRQGLSLAFILCDVDFFKDYNDGYGHQRGDDALIQVADSLICSIERETDFAARYGGEEFALLLPNTDQNGARVVAERVAALLRERQIKHERSRVSRFLTLSMGVVVEDGNERLVTSELIGRADKALYEAKNNGRNRIIFYKQPASESVPVPPGNSFQSEVTR